MIFKGE